MRIDSLLDLQQKIRERMELVKVDRDEYDVSSSEGVAPWDLGYTFALKLEREFLTELYNDITRTILRLEKV